jgi:hypothetical protein
MFSISGIGQASADGITVTVGPATPFVDFSASAAGGNYQVNVAQGDGDPSVQLYSGAAPIGYYTRVNTSATPNLVSENDDFGSLSAQISGTVTAGNYTIRISWCGWFCYTYPLDVPAGTIVPAQTYTLTYTHFTEVTQISSVYFRTPPLANALRVDSAGATTLKDNVVSCTPGKYTFLNGGSTAETANIQSYVYTLLVNGKAVSTLSTDNFRSVASHQFPTIAGNMAGTATLEGATWDLKGMSNYSATCQVYAFQSGGNIQSVTTEAHDAVALAAAAEAAANVARDKEIISTWNAANEELAKKYRDQRLAVQP